MSRRVLACVSSLCALGLILGASDVSAKRKKKGSSLIRAVVLPVKVSELETDLARQLGGVMLKELRQIGAFKMLTGRRINKQIRRLRD